MALFGCGECGSQISDKAAACPKCGAPVPVSGQQAPSAPQAPVEPRREPASLPPRPRKPFFSVARVLAWLFILGGGFLIFRLATGASLVGAITGPRTLVNERIELQEGSAQGYGFELHQSARVDVSVGTVPKSVNLMLMSEQQWSRYRDVKGSLWGGEYQYNRALSRKGVLDWHGSEVLPAGKWRVVVERPREAILFEDSTLAQVIVVVH